MIPFFQAEEETRIIEAIRQAEDHTSGEIRVHLEKNCKRSVLKEAARTFHKLGMDQTALRNGVLIFLAPERKEFAIIGDKGINEVVPADFWDDVRNTMQNHFRHGEFTQGVCEALAVVGTKLKAFFPVAEDDINELPDELSYGDGDQKEQ